MKFLILSIVLFVSSCSESHSKPNYVYNYKDEGDVLGKIGEKNISISGAKDSARFKIQLFEKENEVFNLKMARLKEGLVETLVAPKKGSLSTEKFLEKNVYNKIKIASADIDKFIKDNNIPSVHINDQFKERVKQHLGNLQKNKALETWLGSQLKGKNVEVYFNKPQRPLFNIPEFKEAPKTGATSPKVTVVEFSDFQCPACAAAVPVLNKLKKRYSDKVQFVYKSFPLDFHKQAKTASMAAMCLHEQKANKFWDFHDFLFKNQKAISVADLKKYAKNYGVDQAKFDSCLDSGKFKAMVEKDLVDGKKVGVFSTPTFFVNGRIVTGALPFEQFSELIESELK